MNRLTVTVEVEAFVESQETVKPWSKGNGKTLLQYATIHQTPFAPNYSFPIQHMVNNESDEKDFIMNAGKYSADVIFEDAKDKFSKDYKLINFRLHPDNPSSKIPPKTARSSTTSTATAATK